MLESRLEGLCVAQDFSVLFIVKKPYTVSGVYDPVAYLDPEAWDAENITGWAMQFSVRERPDSSIVLLDKTTIAGITIVSPLAGTVLVEGTAEDTLDWRPGLRHGMLRRTGTGTRTPLWRGVIPWLGSAAR